MSCEKLAAMMEKYGLQKDDERIYFVQLFGMIDNLTYVLGYAGFNAAKYIPYAPIHSVMPYLLS